MSTQIYEGGMRIVDAHDKKVIRHSRKVLDTLLVLGITSLLAVLINFIYPYKTITLLEPIEIKGPVYAGEPMFYRVHLFKYIDKPARISRSLVNERTITYTAYSNNLEPGEHNRIFFLNVPIETNPGHHHLEITWEYDINSMRTVTVKKMSVPFIVLPPRSRLNIYPKTIPHGSPPMLQFGDLRISK
jgi:hypothetical protein